MSSSRSGQWIPSPRPINRQWRRSVGVACTSRGYHARGTAIDRPSTRSTVSVSSLTITRAARAGQCSIGEVLIPRPQELRLVGADQLENTCQLGYAEAAALLESYGIQPDLGPAASSLDMNVRRLDSIAGVEEEA